MPQFGKKNQTPTVEFSSDVRRSSQSIGQAEDRWSFVRLLPGAVVLGFIAISFALSAYVRNGRLREVLFLIVALAGFILLMKINALHKKAYLDLSKARGEDETMAGLDYKERFRK
jgi:hypothetical protein